MGFEIPDVTPAFGVLSWTASQAGCLQRLPHRSRIGAIARRVDLLFADVANIGAAAEEMAEMAFLVAP